MKTRKIVNFFYIFPAFLYLFLTLLQLSLQMLLLYVRLRLWGRTQAWSFRKACGEYVKGASLKRLSELYSNQLRQVLKQLSITYWLNQAQKLSFEKQGINPTTSSSKASRVPLLSRASSTCPR